MFKNIIKKIFDNKFYIMSLLIGFIILLLIMSKVSLYADDFGLLDISNKGIKEIMKYQILHYSTWGGGFTPLLVTTSLLGGNYLWKIIISLLIVFSNTLIINLFDLKEDKKKAMYSLIFWGLFFMQTINILRETVFWLDGSMAYVFTTFQVVLYFYFLISRICLDKRKKYDYLLFPTVAFFAGWSSAQTGALVIIIPIFLLIYSIAIKRKVKLIEIISIILGCIGFLIFYFAPGNSARMENFVFFNNLNIFEKAMYRLNDVFRFIFDFNRIDKTSVPFFMLLYTSLLCSIGLKSIRKFKINLVNLCFIYLFLYLITMLYISFGIHGSGVLYSFFLNFEQLYNSSLSIMKVFPYIFSFGCIFSILICTGYIAKKKNSTIMFYAIIFSLVSQGVMIMSPYTEYRTVYIAIIFIIIAIIDCINLIIKEKIRFSKFYLIPVAILQPFISLIILLINLFLDFKEDKKLFKFDLTVFVTIIFIICMYNVSILYYKYSVNKSIHDENIIILENSQNKDKIVLKRPIYADAGYTNEMDFTKEAMKKLYKLKNTAQIIYE